jgi:uncharacterized protein YbjT (DUF2867 family)
LVDLFSIVTVKLKRIRTDIAESRMAEKCEGALMAGQVLVIGVTGSVGSEVALQLSRKGEQVRGATRKPARRSSSIAEFVEFDFERPETFTPALHGVDRVFLMARPGDEQADRVVLPLIDEMKRIDIRHVVNLSAFGANKRDETALRKIEKHLENSGMDFTHLRPNWFMQIFTSGPLLAGIRATEAIHIPAADAKISYIDVRDIAAVATAAFTEPGHAGKACTLTGPQSLDHHEIAREISSATGKSIQYSPISEEAARKAIQSAGLSFERVERLIEFYRIVRAGFCAFVSSDMESVLGRSPITFQQFAKDHASYWQ